MFWKELQQKKKPFFVVAPMADVTDAAFRELLVRYGKFTRPDGSIGGGPDVMWTEFVSANGLMSPGRAALMLDLMYGENERPIVAQFFSADPDKIEGAAKLAATLGFDGVDINMGCPDRTIEKQGAGACMIRTPEIARLVIQAAKRGIQQAGKDIPVSVKTRVGYLHDEIDTWIPVILGEGVATLTVHARTRKDLSKVPANWDYIRRVVELRDRLAPETVIIGNGDVTSLADGRAKAAASGCDGVMVGRALFGNPWFFDEQREVVAALPKRRAAWIRKVPFLNKLLDTKRTAPTSLSKPITVQERLTVLMEHTRLFEEKLGAYKNFAIMKKRRYR